MAKADSDVRDRLKVALLLDVPLQEVSGICLRRQKAHHTSLLAVGDREALLAMASQQRDEPGHLAWKTVDLTQYDGARFPARDPQIEAVCADGAGQVLLLREQPPVVDILDPAPGRSVRFMELKVKGAGKVARSWNDPESSCGEGMVMLPVGHLLVAKEKGPAALIEFGPSGDSSRGWKRFGALRDGAKWQVKKGQTHLDALAIWKPDEALRRACKDFSDLEIGQDGRLYALSDQSCTIVRLGPLPPGGGVAVAEKVWHLPAIKGKPEGLAFTAEGCALVALDKRKARKNLVLLEPAIAACNGD